MRKKKPNLFKWNITLGLLLLTQVSCIEDRLSSDPDGQIVVIGNGAQGEAVWQKTLVVDVMPRNSAGVQSLIVESAKMVTVQEKLKVSSQLPAVVEVSPAKKSNDSNLRLGWIAPAEKDGQVILKVSAQKLDQQNECKFFRAVGNQVECVNFDDLKISDHFRPEFRKDSSIYFIDTEGDLKVSFDQSTSQLVAEKVQRFFFDLADSLFYQSEAGRWYSLPHDQLKSEALSKPLRAHLISSGEGLFRTDESEVFIYLASAGVGLSASLEENQLYRFDSVAQTFERLWKGGSLPALPLKKELSVVQGSSFFVMADLGTNSMTGNPRSALVELSPAGITNLPSFSFPVSAVIAGKQNIFVKANLTEQSKVLGQVCARSNSVEPDAKRFSCKTLVLPAGQRAVESTLEGDQVVIALNKVKTTVDLFEVAALSSSLASSDFGQIIKSWDVADPIKELRFFDITGSKTGSL